MLATRCSAIWNGAPPISIPITCLFEASPLTRPLLPGMVFRLLSNTLSNVLASKLLPRGRTCCVTLRPLCRAAQLGSELVVPSSYPLSDSGRRPFPRPHAPDPSPLSPLPAGGRTPSGLSRKFVDALKRRFQQRQLIFPGSLRPLQNEKAFRAFLRPLFRQNWVVYAKPPFGGPHHVL